MASHNFRRIILLKAFKLWDFAVMAVGFILAFSFSKTGPNGINHILSTRIEIRSVLFFLGFAAIWHLLFSLFGLYQSRRLQPQRYEVFDIIKATSLGTLILMGGDFLLNMDLTSSSFLAIFWGGVTTTACFSRLTLRWFLARVRKHGRNTRFLLIVGANARTVKFARKIQAKPELGCRVVGFADTKWTGLNNFAKSGFPLVCDLDGLPQFLREHVIDEVVIGLPIKSLYAQASKVVHLCEEHGIVVGYLSNIFNFKRLKTDPVHVEIDSVITLYQGHGESQSLIVKRMFDFVLSLVLLTLLIPLFLVVSILIKLTSPGPVFFVQERLGLNKRKFKLYKFRTMVNDAEKRLAQVAHLNEVCGPVFKIRNDPRLTILGKFLRRTSIDELPQLLNVLKGDMSLVGPRPLPVRDYQGFDQDWHRRRFSMRPGLTCLWQVSGRNLVPFSRWMELDMQYIDHWSVWLDIRILFKTVPAVVRGIGAA